MTTKLDKKSAREVADQTAQHGEVLLYRSEKGQPAMEVVLHRDTVWLTLNQISNLFGRDKSVISRHLKNVYAMRELSRKATVAKNATVQKEAGREVRRHVEYYNLDAILSVRRCVSMRLGHTPQSPALRPAPIFALPIVSVRPCYRNHSIDMQPEQKARYVIDGIRISHLELPCNVLSDVQQ